MNKLKLSKPWKAAFSVLQDSRLFGAYREDLIRAALMAYEEAVEREYTAMVAAVSKDTFGGPWSMYERKYPQSRKCK